MRAEARAERGSRRADGAAPLPAAAARCLAPRSPGPAAAPGPTPTRGGGRRALVLARCLFFFPRHQVICQDNRGGEKQLLPHTHAHLPPPPSLPPPPTHPSRPRVLNKSTLRSDPFQMAAAAPHSPARGLPAAPRRAARSALGRPQRGPGPCGRRGSCPRRAAPRRGAAFPSAGSGKQ